MPTKEEETEQFPECPYNCPYSPNRTERPENDSEAEVTDLDEESCPLAEKKDMSVILRETDHDKEIHFTKIWDTDFGPKVGVKSKKEYKHVFQEVEWERAHHKWNSERVTDTDMWELDLDALFYVATKFYENEVEVTIDDEVLRMYIAKQEGQTLDI